MNLLDAISARHSVRAYKPQPLSPEVAQLLEAKISEVNRLGNLHIQLIQNEPRAFQGILAYGKFSGVTSYLVMIGRKSPDLDERIGYYGEQLVLYAQTLGLNTCWVGLSYQKVANTFVLGPDEHVACYISIGYGATQGVPHKIKTLSQVSNADAQSPDWFVRGVQAALLAPTAVNQQKFSFHYLGVRDRRHLVQAKKGFSLIGYTHMDLGIAKYHFELGAGKDNFQWVE